jgi:hypothetical protein
MASKRVLMGSYVTSCSSRDFLRRERGPHPDKALAARLQYSQALHCFGVSTTGTRSHRGDSQRSWLRYALPGSLGRLGPNSNLSCGIIHRGPVSALQPLGEFIRIPAYGVGAAGLRIKFPVVPLEKS